MRTPPHIPLVGCFFLVISRFGFSAPLSLSVSPMSARPNLYMYIQVSQPASKAKLKIFLKRRKRASVNNLIYLLISRRRISLGAVRDRIGFCGCALRIQQKHTKCLLSWKKKTHAKNMKMKWNEITMATAEKMIVRLSVHDWFGLYLFHFAFNPLFVFSGWAVVMATTTAAVNNVLDIGNSRSETLKKTINTKELWAQIDFFFGKCLVDEFEIITI